MLNYSNVSGNLHFIIYTMHKGLNEQQHDLYCFAAVLILTPTDHDLFVSKTNNNQENKATSR